MRLRKENSTQYPPENADISRAHTIQQGTVRETEGASCGRWALELGRE